jgi:hypothetical protein
MLLQHGIDAGEVGHHKFPFGQITLHRPAEPL